MFAAVAAPFAEDFDRIVLVVAVGVAEAIEGETVLTFAIHIEAVERVEQSHRAPDRQSDPFDVSHLALWSEENAQHGIFGILRRDDQAAFRIDRQANPGTFARFRRAEEFDFEAGQGVQRLSRSCLS